MTIKQVGYGTEKLTTVLREYFLEKKIERFDRDELTTFNQIEDRLQEFHGGAIDILVGTQMLSKGHNFRKVNLVVVMGVDAQLNFPDFRATERAYQLITQVCGRPGRFGEKSEVVIQTMNIGNPIFKMIQDHGFDEFYQSEVPLRKICDCPPFAKIAMIYLTGKNSSMVKDSAINLGSMIEVLISKHFSQVSLLGPRPALIEKRVNKYTWSLMIKSEDVNQLHNILRTIKKNHKLNAQISVKIDIDPYQIA
jgi:primosomal protein N' (replication factor Y)